MPLDSAAVALGALAETASGWGVRLLHLPAAVPPPVVAALSACLVAFGCVHLWTTRRSAHVGVGVLVFAGVVAAAALQRAPLGVPRIDIFLLPYGAVAIACAFAGVERFSKRLALAAAALLLGTLAVQAPARELTYPLQYSAGLVDRLAGDLGPQDGLIVNIHGTFALAVYGPWQTELADNDRLGVPFPKPPIEHLVVFDRESDLGAVELRRVPRIYVFSCHDVYAVHGSIVRRLEDGGYVSRRSTRNPGCALDLLERS